MNLKNYIYGGLCGILTFLFIRLFLRKKSILSIQFWFFAIIIGIIVGLIVLLIEKIFKFNF